ncbi:MAG: hypothetical protein PHE17_19665 [Thiothrix sp.]|uniref:hypothetical protein n=1 Tax=Thiothrix sp. TaxID=1032 RepID=UPI00263458D4|nr:hypothetical protein [Thiothrix sp.]MDD5395246.1 hypothetical protein [Thiothrix sp.]
MEQILGGLSTFQGQAYKINWLWFLSCTENVPLTLAFDQIVKPYFDKILANGIQAKALTNLRDTLLPKLLSGELRIPEAESVVEEALA